MTTPPQRSADPELVGTMFRLARDLYDHVTEPSSGWAVMSDPRWDHATVISPGGTTFDIRLDDVPRSGQLGPVVVTGVTLPLYIGWYEGAYYAQFLRA